MTNEIIKNRELIEALNAFVAYKQLQGKTLKQVEELNAAFVEGYLKGLVDAGESVKSIFVSAMKYDPAVLLNKP